VRSALATDPLEAVARVAAEKRAPLLRAYGAWLARREDLEDCYSQATLELLQRAQRGGRFQGAAHIANALEQKLCSRIHDRLRALAGRSAGEAALAGALRLADGDSGVDVPDPRAVTEEVVAARVRLRQALRLAGKLSRDQRLALACQIHVDADSRELCTRLGWSQEKYRKVAQRGRARLRLLVDQEDARPAGRAASETAPGPTYESHASRS
jgi:DNA-directed RNA polymerase specialized sigma24 family protein